MRKLLIHVLTSGDIHCIQFMKEAICLRLYSFFKVYSKSSNFLLSICSITFFRIQEPQKVSHTFFFELPFSDKIRLTHFRESQTDHAIWQSRDMVWNSTFISTAPPDPSGYRRSSLVPVSSKDGFRENQTFNGDFPIGGSYQKTNLKSANFEPFQTNRNNLNVSFQLVS